MAEHQDRTTDRRRELHALLQGEYPAHRMVVESVTTGGFDGFLVWTSRPNDGQRTVVYKLTRGELSGRPVADIMVDVRTAIESARPVVQP